MLHFSLRIRTHFLVFSCALCASHLGGHTVEDVAETKDNLLKVVEQRRLLSAELLAWREQKEIMESQLRLDHKSLEQIEARLQEARPLVDSLLAEESRLQENLHNYRDLKGYWHEKLTAFRHRLGGLVHQFHPGLKADLVPKFRDLESIDLDGNLSGMKRAFSICLEIIEEANAYNGKIHLNNEIHRRQDGRNGQFRVIYLGLSGGYYFSEEAGQAGRIIRRDGKWDWIEEPKLLGVLMDLEAVLSKRDPPRFVALPFALSGVSFP